MVDFFISDIPTLGDFDYNLSISTCSVIPEDIHAITSLQHFDVRLNKLRDRLPQTLGRLNSFIRLNVRGNGLSELDTTTLPYLELLNCSENALGFLNIGEGPLRVLSAKSNREWRCW